MIKCYEKIQCHAIFGITNSQVSIWGFYYTLPMKPTYILIYLILWATQASAQQLAHRRYTTAEGLPQMQVMDVAQDQNDVLWIGTKNGLCTFDGVTFNDKLGGEKKEIYAVLVNKKREVFAFYAHQTRLEVYENYKLNPNYITNKEVLTKYESIESPLLAGDTVWLALTSKPTLEEDKAQNEKTRVSTIAFLFNHKITILPKTKIIAQNGEHTSAAVTNNTLYLSSSGFGIFRFNAQTQTLQNIYKFSPSEKINGWNGIKTTDDGNIYLLSSKYVAKLVNGRVLYLDSGDIGCKYSYLKEKKQLLYFKKIGDRTQKLVIMNTQGVRLSTLNIDINLPYSVIMDKEGNYWIASEEGLVELIKNGFINFYEKDGMPPKIWQIIEDKNQNMWFAPYEMRNGICKYNDQTLKRYYVPKPTADVNKDHFYFAGHCTPKNELMFTTATGLLSFTEKNGFKTVFDKGVIFNTYQSSTTQDVFIGAAEYNGFYFKKNNTNQWQQYKTLRMRNVIAATQDKDQNYWFGGFGGMGVFDGKSTFSISAYDTAYGSTHSHLRGMCYTTDHKGNVWMGSIAHGFLTYNTNRYPFKMADSSLVAKRIQIINDSNYLSNTITAIKYYATPKDTFLLFGHSRGFGMFDLAHWYKTKQIRIQFFDDANGFMGHEVEQNAITVDSKNRIWIATNDLLTLFDFPKYRKNDVVPNIYIKQLVYFDGKLKPNTIFDNNTYQKQPNQELVLKPSQNNIQISFIGISTTAPTRVQYSYRLMGSNASWSVWNTDTKATFTNLAAGDYRFEVRSINSETPLELADKQMVSLTFRVEQIWYKKWFFLLFYVLFLMASVALVTQLLAKRKRAEILTELRLKEGELVRSQSREEISKMQFQMLITQLNPHFINNVLTGIQNKVFHETESFVAISYLAKLIRSLFMESRSGKMVWSLAEEMDFLQHYLDLQKFRFPSNFEYTLPIKAELAAFERIKIPIMYLQIHCENAIEHGIKAVPDGKLMGKLIVSVAQVNQSQIAITITDNGVGRTEASQKNSRSTKQGTAMLSEVSDIFNKNNNNNLLNFTYQDAPQGGGTTVTVFVPTHYKYD